MSDRNVIRLDDPPEDKAARRPRPFSAFDETPNLILLGDPGAGKTHLFNEAARASRGQYVTARTFLNIQNSPPEAFFSLTHLTSGARDAAIRTPLTALFKSSS